MNKGQKVQVVEEISESFKISKAIIITHYHGLTVSQISILRKSIRESGANFRVVKNSLAKLAVKNTSMEGLENYLSGPVAIAYSNDPVSIAKNIIKFSKENDKLKVVGGFIENKIVDINYIQLMSTLPSLEELRGKILGVLVAPARNLVSILQAPAVQIARVLDAYSKKD